MGTFVLVHGGWGGGWEWRFVADRLATAEHVPFRVTLTGMGERSHLARPDVDLDTHIEDVSAVIETEELDDVVLVGHSYGGAVVTGVVDRIPARIRRVVYVDGFVPRDGESVLDLGPTELAEALRATARDHGDGWQTGPPFTGEWDADVPDGVRVWYRRHIAGQPLATFEAAIRLTGAGAAVPKTYVACRSTREPTSLFDVFADRARTAGWEVRQLSVGHDAHVIDPDGLFQLLVEAAAMPSPIAMPG